MALVATDAIDPGPPQVMDGIAPGFGPGTPVTGATSELKTLKSKLVTLTFSGTYASGGYTLSTDQMGGLKALFVSMGNASGYVMTPTYNADGTIVVKLYRRAADAAVLAEVPNTTAIAFVARLFVMGREA